MAQYLPLPNGQYFEIREGETPEQALAAAVEKYPSAFGLGEQKPKQDTKGFKAAAAAGFERLKGETALTAGKLGLMGLTEAEQYQKEKEEAAKARFTPTEEGWTESPWQKFKETAGGSLPYMAAPAAAGLAALAAPAALPAAALGAGAAGLVSAGQFTGTNLARQMETGKTLEQTSLGSAVGAAIPQAALDTAAMALLPGVGKLFGSVGSKLTTEEAKAIASQTLGKAAMDYTAKTGMAMGREGLTETMQQVLERVQAGLSIADPEARKEYVDSFIGGAALAGVGAPVGRYMERSGAKIQAAKAEQDEQAKAAAEVEAAKNAPDALRQLNDTYGLAQEQLAALNQKVNAAKPKKGATEEQKAAYDELKAQRADFINGTFKPLKQEYDQRKGAIEQLLTADQSAIEVAGAKDQQAAKLPLPSDIPGAQPFQLTDTARLMDEHDKLRNQLAAVEQQLAAGPDVDTQNQLMGQRSQMVARMGEMAPIIHERGGVADTEKNFNSAMAAADKERLRLLELGDFDAAAKQAAKIKDMQARAPFFQELNDFRTKSGQNRDLFAEAPATPTTAVDEQLKQQTLEEERNRGLYGPESKIESAKQAFGEAGVGPRGQLELAPAAAEPKAQTAIKPKQLAETEAAQEKVTAAQTALNAAVKTKDTTAIYAATDALNRAKSAGALAQDEVGRGMFRPVVLDLFSPSNIINTAIQNGDSQTINNIATHTDSTALNAALDEKASERDKLVNVLENRAGVGGTDKAARVSFAPTEEGKETEGSIRTVEKGKGEQLRSVKRERANLFEKQYDAKQQALFKNGTYPDKKLQALYDKGGPAAVEYENVMQAIEALSKQVTTKQGNAKKSLYEQLVDLAAQHEALVKQLESGVATPTQREKVAGLQAKLGKGEAPAERQMDASERHNLQRKINGVVNQYKLVEGKITPVRDQILRLHDSLYTTTAPLEKVSVVAEKKESEARVAASKQAAAVKAGEARTPKSRGAATAARINAGDVRKEAETSQKMRDLALLLGAEEEEYKKFNKNLTDRYAKLKEKYGKNDPAVANFQRTMAEQLNEKAMSLGKKTPEYKATLKEQIAYFQDTLANVNYVVGAQKAPSKRATQVTRKQSGAPSRLVSSSPESRAESEAEGLRLKRRMMRDFEEGATADKEGRDYLRGVETESIELDSTTVSLLKQNDIRSALTRIGADPRVDDFSRTVAKVLKTFLDKTDIKLVDNLVDNDGKEVLGAATSKLVELNTNGGLSVETLLHEATHAAAERIIQLAETAPDKLTREQKLAINELKAIHAQIKNDAGITSKNAKGSLSEFVAEVMSNRNLQKQLAQRKWRMSDMWKGIKSVIMRMLGIKDVETMFGASAVAIEQLFIPSSVRNIGGKAETKVTRSLSAKDIAALHDGTNSMKQFADQFGPLIKQKDRTPEDVERIGANVIEDMINSAAPYRKPLSVRQTKEEFEKSRAEHEAKSVVAIPTADTLDYKGMTIMSDGKPYDENNPLHYVEAEPATFAALKALEDPDIRTREADAIASQRRNDFSELARYLLGSYENYTTAETALVLKAAAKYGVISDRNGKLKLVEIGKDNRHNIAVVGKEAADAVIEQLRAGKGLKQAFLDGLQKNADDNAKTNERKNGWKKFDQSDSEEAAVALNAGCAGTPWCTGASVGTARSQIGRGDFYVHYKNGRPEVAVRMDGTDRIGEVRGNNPNQALDADQQQLAESFLRSKNFSNADKYVDEFARKERFIQLAKGDADVTVQEMLSSEDSLIDENGKPESSYTLDRALSFRTIDGYGNRPKPTKAVTDFFVKKYIDAAKKAYADGNFVFSDVDLETDDTPITVEFAGTKYTTTTAEIKSAKGVTVSVYSRYASTDAGEVRALKLQRTGTINMFRGKGVFPSLQSAKKVVFFRGGSFGEAVVTTPSNAKIGEVTGYDSAAHGTIIGPKVVGSVVLRDRDRGLFLDLPDTEFVAIDDGSVSVAKEFGNSAAVPLASRMEKDGWSYSAQRKLMRGDAPSEDAESMRAVIEPYLREYFEAIRQDFGPDTYDKVLQNTDIERAYNSYNYEKAILEVTQQVLEEAGYTREAFDKMANIIKYTTGETIAYPGAELIAPNRRGDAPKVAELEEAPEERRFAPKDVGVQKAKDGTFSFARKQSQSTSVVAQEPGIVDTVLGNIMGLAGRVQYVDQYAALEAATKKGLSAGQISSLEATNANYLLRFGQQRSQFAGQFLTNGPVQAVHNKKDGGVETVYRSTKGTSMIDVASALNKAKLAGDIEQENMFTLYLAGKRANQVGWDKLNFSKPAQAKAEYDAVMARLKSSPEAAKAFEEAASLYQKYNAGLLDFLVQTGALSAKKAAELKSISYVPFYRINGNGEVQLMIDKEHPIRIANIKDQPQLKELVGGNTAILPIFTSAAQNTFMITGMGLRNQAVKETAFMLQKMGVASAVRQGKGPASDSVVRFQKNGEDYYALIDNDMHGIPAELIVRGMEGIKTTLPAVIKLLGVSANILRSFVVRNPTYALRQIIRDPLNAWLTTGTDATPILSSMKELASMVAGRSDAERKLMETGAISSNIYSGDERDMSKFLKDMAAGKSGWEKAVAKLDAFALQGDAATRAVIYKDSLAKGMTEQEALLRTLESMNFSRRGVSPSMHALSVMIPFFNAQIQGLDVLYRAFKGDMPYSEQLAIREKLVKRGLLLAGATIAYAAMMEDDEAYKRAKPEERYGNWFVYVPGVSEPVRVPIPFELGFLFKALPEAVWNLAMQDEKAGNAAKGLGKLAMQTVPLSLPQAVKPLTEAVLGKSFYSGDIESTREKDILATERYRESTTELAKMIGSVTGKAGVSPITLDYLLRGYTGGLGVALVQLANPMLAPDAKEVAQPSTKPSKVPFVGGLFQPVEGRGTLDEAYDRMSEIRQIKGAYNDMVERGQKAEAKAFAQDYADKLAAMSLSGSVQKRLGELAKVERQIKANPNMTIEQKDAKLEQLDKTKVAIARQFLAVTDRTTTR
jgi:hypothetical protein